MPSAPGVAVLNVATLPGSAVAAAAAFHAEVLPRALALLAEGAPSLVLVFPPADHSHRGWRLAAVQGLAREHAPCRVNALAADDPEAIAAALHYLDGADGVTGQYLPLDSHGAGSVVFSTS